MMVPERRFTSDAAPNFVAVNGAESANQVAQLSTMIRRRGKALLQLHFRIDRAIVWLINCSRYRGWTPLDNLQGRRRDPAEDLLQSSVMDIYHTAQQAKIDVRLTLQQRHQTHRTTAIAKFVGAKFADNAVRYSPQGSV